MKQFKLFGEDSLLGLCWAALPHLYVLVQVGCSAEDWSTTGRKWTVCTAIQFHHCAGTNAFYDCEKIPAVN